MYISLEKLSSHLSNAGLLAMMVAVLLRMRRLCFEWLPLLWEGRRAIRKSRSNHRPLDVDIERLPRSGLVHRWYEWSAEARSGRLRLGFDDWLTGMALPSSLVADGIAIRQKSLQFHLRHGRRYLICDSQRGERVFECRIDGRLPIVAFIDGEGRRGPWITIPKLFTIEEIVGMTPQP